MSCGCAGACSLEPEPQAESSASVGMQIRLAVAVFFGMTTMTLAWVAYLEPFGPLPAMHAQIMAWAMGALSAPVVLVGGGVFVKEARDELARRSVGMSTLVTLAVFAAWIYSWVMLANGTPRVFFDTASMIVVFLLVGRVIETRLGQSSSRALDAWLRSLPSHTWKICHGKTLRVEAKTMKVGQTILVPAGEMVPLDGVVTRGVAEVERSMLTGESLPVTVGEGDAVEAGAINLDGELRLRVTRAVGERGIEALIDEVKRCARQRPRLQRVADRFAARLTYVAGGLALAMIAFGPLWLSPTDALLRGLAVLLVACPCVAGLATPAAIAAGATAAARAGFVLRSPEAFEALATANRVVFDKTGTLTESRIRVRRLVTATGITEPQLLAMAAAAERGVRHPIAQALVEASEGLDVPTLDDVRLEVGNGVRGHWQGQAVFVGREAFVADAEPTAPVPGSSWVHVSVGGRWWGAIAVDAPVREGLGPALDELRKRGFGLDMATGDTQAVAEHVGTAVGLDRIHGDLRPRDKALLIETLQGAGSRVAYVGDGINDGPALAAAHVGVAVGSPTAVAEAAAQVVVTSGGAERLPAVLRLARRTFGVMRGNLGWAFAYNAVTIPLALAGRLDPAWAALLMVGSSTFVLGNSLRLLRR